MIEKTLEEIRKIMGRVILAKSVRVDLGKVKISEIFRTEKNRQILGGKVIEGEIKKGILVEIFRGEEKVGQGRIINLQRDKKDAQSAKKGEECGALYEGDVKIEEGDVLVIYTEEKRKEEL